MQDEVTISLLQVHAVQLTKLRFCSLVKFRALRKRFPEADVIVESLVPNSASKFIMRCEIQA